MKLEITNRSANEICVALGLRSGSYGSSRVFEDEYVYVSVGNMLNIEYKKLYLTVTVYDADLIKQTKEKHIVEWSDHILNVVLTMMLEENKFQDFVNSVAKANFDSGFEKGRADKLAEILRP